MTLFKRIFSIILSSILILSLPSCKAKPVTEETSKVETTVSLISERLDVAREDAITILEALSACGLDEQIDEIYTATDDDGNTFYKIWFGLNLLSVYLDGSSVERIFKHGEQIYPKIEIADEETSSEDDEDPKIPEPPELALELVSLTTPVKAGKSATIEVIAEPNTKYSITVRYSSGPSSAKGLEPATSDESGRVSWTWKVSANVKPGEYTIEIKSGNAVYKTTFVVEEASEE